MSVKIGQPYNSSQLCATMCTY